MVQSRTVLVNLSGKKIRKENVVLICSGSFFGTQWEDDANSIALHVYYKFRFWVTHLKRAEFNRVLWLLFKLKVVSSFPASNLRMIVYAAQKVSFSLAASLFRMHVKIIEQCVKH